MAPSTKKSAKATASPSQHDLRSFFGSAQGRGAAGSPQRATSQRKVIEIISEDDEMPTRAAESVKRDKSAAVPTPALKRKANRILLSSDEEDAKEATPPPKKKPVLASASTSRSRKTSPRKERLKRRKKESDYEESSADGGEGDSDPDFMDVDEEEVKKAPAKGKAGAKRAKATSSGAAKVEGKSKDIPVKVGRENQEVDKSKPKFNWAAAKAARIAGPSNPGSKAVPPAAAPDCLAGLSLVFTGELSSFSREDAIDLAKRFCGRVVGQPIFQD